MPSAREVIIYIHGITPAPDPQIHKRDYNSFETLLIAELHTRNKHYPRKRIDIEWGFDLPGITTKDRILAATERALFQKVDEISDKHFDTTVNPLRLLHYIIRKNFVLGVADMFYYVSEDGKAEVRRNVLNTLLDQLPPLGNDESYSFTIVSHSAGTVIMHDLLFIIFGGSSKSFLSGAAEQRLRVLQDYAKAGKVFIKCFVTLGSPITPMIVRSGTLLDRIYNGGKLNGKLDLESIGIRTSATGASSRWLNFWDKDDVASFPVAFLYQDPDNLVEDHYVDIGDLFPDVHLAYWSSQKIAEIIADRY